MNRVADIFGIAGQIEVDEDRTTRTSWIGSGVGFGLVVTSLVFLPFGRGPIANLLAASDVDALTGDPMWNLFGWLVGAVLVPLVVIFFHQLELRQALSPDHIEVKARKKLLGAVLVLGLLISTLHAFLGSVQIQFGV